MKIIDFDNEFRLYMEKWIEDNADNYGDIDDMEAGMINVYSDWLNAPADFIDGVRPINYYSVIDDAKELIEQLIEYKKVNVTIPDLLLDRITELGERAKSPLAELVKNPLDMSKEDEIEIKMLAVNLLSEIDDKFMYEAYVDMLSVQKLDKELASLLIEKLEYAPQEIVDKIFKILETNNSITVRERYADILVHFKDDKRIYNYLVEMFNATEENTGLYAAYLGKYDDYDAIDILTEALDWQGISYIDYMEVRAALERLGEEVNHKRDFSGDSYYESLRHMEQ